LTAVETLDANLSGDVGDFIKQNLAAGDQIVFVDRSGPDGWTDRQAHYVKIRDGVGRVVGQMDVPTRD